MYKVLCFFLLLTSMLFVSGDEEYDEYEDEGDMGVLNSTANSTLIFTKPLENMTAEPGTKIVKLICEVQNLDVNNTNSKVTIKWEKNFAPIEKSKKRISTKMFKEQDHKYRSTLRINNFELFDKGFYSCLASNGINKIRSEALLDLMTESGRTFSTSNTLKFDGEITTAPANAPSSRIFTISQNNQLKKSFKSGKNENSYGLISTAKLISNLNISVCEVYQGQVCNEILENKHVFVQPPYRQEDIEEEVKNAISQLDASSTCYKFMMSWYCYSAFPLCVDSKQVSSKIEKFQMTHSDYKDIRNDLGASLQRICKAECLLLENDLCIEGYASAKRKPITGRLLLEECQTLPSGTNCLTLGIKYEATNKADTCYWGDGRAYRGDESTTKTGSKCLRWAHQSVIQVVDYPELIGHNHCRNPGGIETQPFCYAGDPPIKETCKVTKCRTFDFNPTTFNFSEPFCQVYQGRACKDVLDSKYVFVQPPYTQADIEKKLRDAFLVISQSNDISSSCNKFARPSLCYSAFPLCVDPRQINTYQSTKMVSLNNDDVKDIRNKFGASLQRICREDCLLLETELCSQEYAIAKRHEIINQPLELEDCQFLPNETDDTAKNCLVLGVDHQSVDRDDTCYWDDGQMYRGVENITAFGKKCLRWAHLLQIRLSEYPELTGNNYCRNPGGFETQPFCYVDGNPPRKELCNITKCSHIVWMYIVGSFIICSLLLGVIVGIVCCRKKNKMARNLQNLSIPTADKNIYGNPGPNSPMELNNLLPPNIPPQRHHTNKNGYQNVPQYTYKEVAFVEELGEGAFGKVYKGELKTKAGKIFVAVKSLKENASAKTQADFQREIELISELKHPNIICLLGVVVKQEPMCMLFEFMSEGDLHEFLIANSPSEGKSLTQNQFLHIAIQIAQGMEYLSDNHYVHRDLAARNCLVSKDLVVKISDFGLSRDMYSCDYYRVQSKSLLPVRWMPPESILYGKFTTESDVWSYGVVLWEIYSYGLQPYYGFNNQEVINMIRSRKLLPCPDACPSYCYSLMVECWAELSIRRPSFGEISHRLRVWKQNGNSNGAYFKTPDHGSSQHKFAHSSKSSHKSDSPTVCTDTPTEAATWERKRLTESQSSLTSRTSSLGNKTQSTSLSNEHSRRRSHKRNEDSLDRVNPKNTVVSSNGDNFEIKISL